MTGGHDRRSGRPSASALPGVVLAGLLYGFAEFARQRWVAPSPPGHAGDTGGDLLAYVFLGVTVLGLPAVVAAWVVPRRRSVIWFAALAPTAVLAVQSLTAARFVPGFVDVHGVPTWWAATVVGTAAAGIAAFVLRRLQFGRAPLWMSTVIVLASLTGLVSSLRQAPQLPAKSSDGDLPNVVLLTIDTLRADAVDHVGNAWPSADAPRRAAGRALVPSSWTRPSMASLFSGVVPTGHGTGADRAPSTDVAWWIEDLRLEGYRTLAVAGNPHLRRRFGFDRGFDVFDHDGEDEWLEPIARSFWAEMVSARHDGADGTATADDLVPRAEDLLDRHGGDGPWLLWVHLMDPHVPYNLRGPDGATTDPGPGDWIEPLRPDMDGDRFDDLHGARDGTTVTDPDARRALRRLYQTEVDFALHWSERLLGEATARSGDRDLLWMMTSDHGEEFWDDGGFEHGHSLHASVTEVPLWVGGTLDLPAAPPRRLIDVGPWLLATIGRRGTDPVTGTGLLEDDVALVPFALGREAGPGPWLAEGMLYGPPRTRLRWPDGTEVERNDLTRALTVGDSLDARTERLLVLLDLWRERNAQKGRPVDVSPDLERQLRALGYVQ